VQTRGDAGLREPRRHAPVVPSVDMRAIVAGPPPVRQRARRRAAWDRRSDGILPALMRLSVLFARTLREDPAEAEVPSHRLLLRGAYMRKLMAGVYVTLPLGLRVMRKIEAIVRQEMDASGAQEIRMPIVLPAEPWKKTGRWETYGDLLFRLRDRHGRELLLGPTEEEVVAPLVAGDLPSYRDLPVN